MKIKIKKLNPSAVIPSKRQEDAGWDITATDRAINNASDHGYMEYSTGLAIEIPKGYAGFLFPRSSISKTGLILANAVGVVDSGYRGEITFRFKWIPGTKFYLPGDKIGQLVIMPVPEVELEEAEELLTSERMEGSYGSTGN